MKKETNIWFISDTHFRHKNILEFENRPFKSIEEMEAAMIDAWNNVVKKIDTVYLLGDFCFGNHKAWLEILDYLKGNIVLIKGNHDKSKIIKRMLNEGLLKEIHEVGTILKVDKYILNLTHYPLEIGERPFNFNISGHIHHKHNTYINQINVGVDSPFMHEYYKKQNVPFGTPVSLEYLIDKIEIINKQILEIYKSNN